MHYLIWHNFLNREDCEAIIRTARSHDYRGRLQRSTGYESHTGQQTVSEHRTSSHLFFNRGETQLLASIEQRIAEATGCLVEQGEGFQLAYYPAGTYFKPHHDYFHEEYTASKGATARGGQRIITFMIYLNTLPAEAGGETHFTNMELRVRPEAGKALIFWNMMPNWQIDSSTEHEAVAPASGFEKFTLTKWIRAGTFV